MGYDPLDQSTCHKKLVFTNAVSFKVDLMVVVLYVVEDVCEVRASARTQPLREVVEGKSDSEDDCVEC